MSSGIRDDELLAEGASASPSRGGLDSRDTTLDRGVSSERFHYLKSLTAKLLSRRMVNILLLASHLKMPEAHSNLERETERDREKRKREGE